MLVAGGVEYARHVTQIEEEAMRVLHEYESNIQALIDQTH